MSRQPVEVLVIEDDESHAYVIRRGLEGGQARPGVHVVKSGDEAIELLFRGGTSVDESIAGALRLIVLDLHIPGIPGIEVLRRIKATPRIRRVPVVVLTIRDEEEQVLEGYGLGANGYVVKSRLGQVEQAVGAIGRYWLRLNEPPVWSPPSPDE